MKNRNNGEDERDANPKKTEFNNTLDYYNDDMSRKAVGKLFGSTDPIDDVRDPAEGVGREIVKGFDKTGRHKVIPPVKPLGASEDEAVKGYDFSIYRKNKKDSGWNDYSSPDDEIEPKPIRQAKIQPSMGGVREGRPMPPPKREYTKIERQPNQPYPNKPASPKARSIAYEPMDERGRREGFSFEDLPIRAIALGGGAFALVLIIILSVQLIGANNRLQAAEDNAEEIIRLTQAHSEAQIARDEYRSRVIALQRDLDDANAQLAQLAPPPADPDDYPLGEDAPAEGTPSQTSATTHVVQPGESLSSIARQHYGNASLYPHIRAANNNIAPGALQPGMELIIPPRP